MKKYLALLLLVPALAFAQDKEVENFAEINEQFLSKGLKRIDYEVSIKEGDTLIFKSDFSIMNGEKMTVFKHEIQQNKEFINDKKLLLGKENLVQEIDLAEEKGGNIEILRLKPEITRETNNIVSHFSLTNVDLSVESKESKKSSVNKEDPNGIYNEQSPAVEKLVKEISISHKKEKDILFISNNKTFFIKAKY